MSNKNTMPEGGNVPVALKRINPTPTRNRTKHQNQAIVKIQQQSN